MIFLALTSFIYYKEIKEIDAYKYRSKKAMGIGLFLYDHTTLFKNHSKINQPIIEVYGKTEYKKHLRLYTAQKISIIYVIGLMIMVIWLMIELTSKPSSMIKGIERPSYGEGSVKESLSYQVELEQQQVTGNIEIEIKETMPDSDAVIKGLDVVSNEVLDNILLENSSLDNVTTHLDLYTRDEKYNINIKWFSSNPDIILDNGYIIYKNVVDRHEVILTAYLSYEDMDRIIEIPIIVHQRDLTVEEQLDEVDQWIKDYVKNPGDYLNNEELVLPTTLKNTSINWYEERVGISSDSILLLGLILIGILYFTYDIRLNKMAEKRREAILREFPKLLNKLILLINAGMTFKGAWDKISEDYLEGLKRSNIKSVLYDEMIRTNECIENGMSNIIAYQEFGRRCKVAQVKRFSVNVTQNLKKGGNQLVEVLKEQRKESLDNRRNIAKIKGEKASTKLILPMAVMLVGIMIIVMTPIIMSFNL